MHEASAAFATPPTVASAGALLWVCPELVHGLPPVQVQQRWRRVVEAMSQALPKPVWHQALPAAMTALDADALLGAARGLLQRWHPDTPIHVGLHVVQDAAHPQVAELQAAEQAARRAPLGAVGLSAELADRLSRPWELPLVDLGHEVSDPLKVLALPLEAADGLPDPVALRDVLVVLRPQIGGSDGSRAGACADLLADTLTGSLARSALLRVVARESASRLTDPARALQDAFAVLGASHVLSGRGHLGDSGVLSLQLELLARGQSRALWSDRVTLRVDDLLAGQADSLLRAIADAHAALMSETLSIAQLPAWQSLEDHQLLIGASQFMHRLSPASFERSRLLLEGLRERAPKQALVHAWLAKWHVMAAVQALEPVPVAADAAIDSSNAALRLDPNCALALALTGIARSMRREPLSETGVWHERAVSANPSEALAWMYGSTQAVYEGRLDEALQASRVALALSPLDPWRYMYDMAAAHALLAVGDWDGGLQYLLCASRARARHAPTLAFLVIAQARLGRLDVAHEYLKQLLELWPRYSLTRFWESYPGRETPHAKEFAWAFTSAGLPS